MHAETLHEPAKNQVEIDRLQRRLDQTRAELEYMTQLFAQQAAVAARLSAQLQSGGTAGVGAVPS